MTENEERCFMKKEDKSLIDVENVDCFLRRIGLLFYSIVSSISVLLLSHSVQLTSTSSLVCSLFYPVGVIRLNIATTSGS